MGRWTFHMICIVYFGVCANLKKKNGEKTDFI